MLRDRYNRLIDRIFSILESRTRLLLLLVAVIILTLISAKLVLGLLMVGLFLAGDAIVESYRLFIPRIPVDIELLTLGTIVITSLYGTGVALLFIVLGAIPMTLSRGHFHPSFLIRMLSLAAASHLLAFIGFSFGRAMLAIILALAIQFLGYLPFGSSPVRGLISRTTNLAWNYVALSLAAPFLW